MSRSFKRAFLISVDLIIIFISHIISYFFLYPLVRIPDETFLIHVIIVGMVYVLLGTTSNVFDKINRFTSSQDTIVHTFVIIGAYFIGTLLYDVYEEGISFRYVSFAFVISVVIIPIIRIIWRLWKEYEHRLEHSVDKENVEPVRTLLVGAGEAGAMYVKSLRNRSDISIVGFLDDAKNKQGTTLHGYPVIGKVNDLEDVVNKYSIQQVTIAIPSLSSDEMNDIIAKAKKIRIKVNQMPYIEDILSGDYQIDEFKNIEVTDLLGRDEVELDTYSISRQLKNKTILVTGAGGSIGSEICRQIINFNPKSIILVGHGEFSIYQIERELNRIANDTVNIIPVIADIQDRERIFTVMEMYKPNLVYHAAAHKHVPLMEKNPRESLKNNVLGTKNVAEAAKAKNVKTFIMVSTDKAVNPPNIMGAAKRIAEMIVTGLNEKGHTNFAAVRFGNVLNSSGSVVPVFKEQIENGGPVTVTDFRMTRYFMTIPEASRLVLQAGVLAKGGEIFVLDMGEPVKILDLAKQMVWLSGHTEKDIEIIETGIRPGEKLYEELLASEENTEEKVFDKIFVGKVKNLPLEMVKQFIYSLDELSEEELKEKMILFANNTYDKNLEIFGDLTEKKTKDY